MTVQALLAETTSKFKKNNINTPALDTEILLCSAIHKSRAFLFTHPEFELSDKQLKKFKLMIQRRLNREPIAYITNKKEFYGREFYVDKSVLIPRPKTEAIIENSKLKITNLIKIKNYKLKISVIDIGTGSGCIIITLAKKLANRNINFIGIDISADALEVAKKNAKKHKVNHLIKFYQGNLLTPILNHQFPISNFQFLIIIANLPYITPKKYQTLQPEITKYEPKTALLTPNNDPNYYYKKLDNQIKKLKKITSAKIHRFYELGQF